MISSAAPDISEREIRAVTDALSSGTLSTGEVVEQFEQEFAALIGREHGAAVCSGGVALELAFQISDLDSRAGVVVSPRNCAAVLYPILRQDLVPVFADVEPGGHNLDPDAVRDVVRSIDHDVGAVLATHLHGAACDIEGLVEVAAEHDLELIEDVCQSPGAEAATGSVGTYGSLAVCSFGATKNITTAEGGMIVGDDEAQIERLRRLRSSRHGEADEPLASVRMSDVEAAMGREQLRRYDELVERRRAVAAAYRPGLDEYVGLPEWPAPENNVYANYPVLVDDPDALLAHLDARGIECNTYDSLLYDYECLAEATWFGGPCERAERVQAETIVLPMHSELDPSDAETVVEAVADYYD